MYNHPKNMTTSERMEYIIDQTKSIKHFPTQCIGRIREVCKMEIENQQKEHNQ